MGALSQHLSARHVLSWRACSSDAAVRDTASIQGRRRYLRTARGSGYRPRQPRPPPRRLHWRNPTCSYAIVTERDLIAFAPIFILVDMPEADPIALHYIARALDCEQRANCATTRDIADGWRQIGKSYQHLAVAAVRAPVVSDIHPYRARPERRPRIDPAPTRQGTHPILTGRAGRKAAWVTAESAAALSHLGLAHPKPRY